MKYVSEWLSDVRIEKEDYILPNPDAADGVVGEDNGFHDDISRVVAAVA